ncbi:TPA: hypothetical protein ACH3X1_006033 [Trebouxia sp. C0004]
MELVCSVCAEPLPMQILALANNAGKANQVAATLPDALIKSKVTHLMRCSRTVQPAAAACSMDVLRVWGRWARSEGFVGKSYLPKSPLSALPATGILAGFGADFMCNHAFGRGTVAVPVLWIDTLVPWARFILQAVQVIYAELECSARPLSPQLAEAFDKISKQVCSLSEQVAYLQLTMDSMKQPTHLLAEPIVSTASCSKLQPAGLELAVEGQVGLSSSLSSVREAVEEWFFGLHGFPAPPTLCQQAVQRGQRLSKKAIDNMSKRRHLPLQVQALATEGCWPLKKAMAVYELVMQQHKLSLAELRDAVRLSSPVRHAAAKDGRPAQSQHVNRCLGLPLIGISQFAAWVQQATDDMAKLCFSW